MAELKKRHEFWLALLIVVLFVGLAWRSDEFLTFGNLYDLANNYAMLTILACGLFGLATLITQCEEIFSLIRIVGGAYLLWFAWCSMRRQSTPQMSTLQQPISAPWYVFFRRGLITDLSNPQTVLFFISIFSVTLNAETPTWARLMAWAGIVLASIIWRVFLSQAFSLPAVRRAYGRMQRVASRVIGAIIGVFALRLIYEGVTQR